MMKLCFIHFVTNRYHSYITFLTVCDKNHAIHSGNLDNGHYTAYVFDKKQNKWFKCNDKAVVTETTKTNKKTPYVLFMYKTDIFCTKQDVMCLHVCL